MQIRPAPMQRALTDLRRGVTTSSFFVAPRGLTGTICRVLLLCRVLLWYALDPVTHLLQRTRSTRLSRLIAPCWIHPWCQPTTVVPTVPVYPFAFCLAKSS